MKPILLCLYLCLILIGFSSAAQTTANSVPTILAGFTNTGAGDTLLIAPGEYTIGSDVTVGQAGREGASVVIRAAEKNTVTLRAGGGDQMILIDKKYLVFENIKFDGMSTSHCLHIKPGGGHLVVRNCTFVGTIDKDVKSSAPANGATLPVDDPQWQDYQLYENCEAYPGAGNTSAGGMLNINGPDYVTARGNYIHDFKGDALYCMFVKAGGRYPLFENNIIHDCIVGISFGGGRTGAEYRRRDTVEALDGICRNNVLVDMDDAGLHCNFAKDCKFINNTCINMWGIQNQYSTNIAATNNILMGGSFRGTFVQTTNYVNAYNAAWFWDPAARNYRIKSTATGLVGQGTADVDCQVDFLGKWRSSPPCIGAYEVYSSATELPSPAEKLLAPQISAFSVYPVPARANTSVRVKLDRDIPLLDLTIVDSRGRVVWNFSYDRARAGTHTYAWDGRDHESRPVAAGAYFVRLNLGEKVLARPFTIVR